MSALSIRHMNFTLQTMEHIRAQKDAEEFSKQPANHERTHYWHVQRKAKRGKNNWLFVCEFYGTKREVAVFFCERFRNRTDNKFRLRHQLAY